MAKPMLVSLCNEMNGDWFPWAGAYYGGGQPIAGTNPAQYVGTGILQARVPLHR